MIKTAAIPRRSHLMGFSSDGEFVQCKKKEM